MEKRFGKYEILSRLGAGAQGEVFLATGPDGGKVALKLLHAQFSREKDTAGRFRRESRIAMSVVHPNVVRALDAGEENGRLYMACEYVDGGGLDSLISREGKLGEDKALEIFRGILSGLDAICRAGIIHRDVKPANVMLDSKGTARLTDLGLARSTSADRTRYTATGMLVGSPAYMAPEQVEPTGELDISCDLYSAGIVLFQALSGQLPFKGATILDTLRAQVESPPPRLRDIEPSVREAVSDLVYDLMRKDPRERPSTPADVLSRLDSISPGKGSPPADAFGSTLDSGSELHGTPNIAECPPKAIEPASFPVTLDIAEDAFPVTIGVIEATPRIPEAGILLAPAPGSAVAGPSRAKILFPGPEPRRTLFVYAGSGLRMGRDGLDRCDSEVCLRLRPSKGNEDAIRRISGRHMSVEVEGSKVFVRDLGSTCGTTIDGRPLPPDSPVEIARSAIVRVAGVIELEVSVVRQDAGSAPSVAGIGQTMASVPSVFVSRPGNGSEHAYALVPGRLSLLAGPVVKWAGAPNCGIELFCVNGGLWARGGSLPPDRAVALTHGSSLEAGGARMEVSEIAPADQK